VCVLVYGKRGGGSGRGAGVGVGGGRQTISFSSFSIAVNVTNGNIQKVIKNFFSFFCEINLLTGLSAFALVVDKEH
jgi:hypothetical protein